MNLKRIQESMMEVLLASYEHVKFHIYPLLLNEEERETISTQCVTVRQSAYSFALVIDFQRICELSSITAYVTRDLLLLWNKNADIVAEKAWNNLGREMGYGFELLDQFRTDASDTRHQMWGLRFRTALASKYACGIIRFEPLLQQIYGQLGCPFNLYLFGAGDILLSRAYLMGGGDKDLSISKGYFRTPAVAGPLLVYDGDRLAFRAHNVGEVQVHSSSLQEDRNKGDEIPIKEEGSEVRREANYYSNSLKNEKEAMETMEKEEARLEENERVRRHNDLMQEAEELIRSCKKREEAHEPDKDSLEAFKALWDGADSFARWTHSNLVIESDEKNYGRILLYSDHIVLNDDVPEDIGQALKDMLCGAAEIMVCRGPMEGTVGVDLNYMF